MNITNSLNYTTVKEIKSSIINMLHCNVKNLVFKVINTALHK